MGFLPGWLVFAAIALVFWGITGVTQKLSTNNISSELSFIWFAYAMIAISVVLALTVPINQMRRKRRYHQLTVGEIPPHWPGSDKP